MTNDLNCFAVQLSRGTWAADEGKRTGNNGFAPVFGH
jgi:hypothetical protein